MIDLYTWTTPNGRKVSIMLEETGLDYAAHPVNLQMQEQFKPKFLRISPNNRIPAIIDQDAEGGPVSVFESGAILIYLAEKTGQFLPASGAARAKVLEWLMWQMGGVGPMMGQASHFINSAPEQIPYAINRYLEESARLIKLLDDQLAEREFVAGEYSIADMAIYPWVAAGFEAIRNAKPDMVGNAANCVRWIDALKARPAVAKGMAVPEV
ncbi:glutathione S-transferase N-terminal domain-containing protein [Pyruvatibacter mobilis]|uniref:glutathione S-transferase N-terminal domain-containing protein n=1 Tax=Pyruvatibacter mobilis TaxID=1712261 RepID=UPI003BAC4503